MKIMCFNKTLKTILPAEKVVSQDKLFWLESVLKHSGNEKYEDDLYIFTPAKDKNL